MPSCPRRLGGAPSLAAIHVAPLTAAHEMRPELGHGATAELPEDPIDLRRQHLQRPLDTLLTTGCQAVQHRSPQHHGIRPQCERLDYVRTAAESAVHNDRE